MVLGSSRGTEYAAQLSESLCVSMECVPEGRVLSGGRLDLAKVQKERVAAVVLGRMVKAGAGWRVELSVRNAQGATGASTSVPVSSSGKLSVIELMSSSARLISAIENPKAAATGKLTQKAKGKKGPKLAKAVAKGRARS